MAPPKTSRSRGTQTLSTFLVNFNLIFLSLFALLPRTSWSDLSRTSLPTSPLTGVAVPTLPETAAGATHPGSTQTRKAIPNGNAPSPSPFIVPLYRGGAFPEPVTPPSTGNSNEEPTRSRFVKITKTNQIIGYNETIQKPNQINWLLDNKESKRRLVEREVNFLEAVSGRPGDGFFIAVKIGTPPQRLNVLVDTGSSNFAVAGKKEQATTYFERDRSSTLKNNWMEVSLKYTQGKWRGDLVSDVVTLADCVPPIGAVPNFVVITSSSHFFLPGAKWQGIMGLAYPRLAHPNKNPTFVDLAVKEKGLSDVFALQLCGTKSSQRSGSPKAGHLAIGGVDPSGFDGDMFFTPIIREWYYEVVIADVDVDGVSLDVPCGVYNNDRTIVDSGTTNFQVPRLVLNTLVSSLEKATWQFWPPIPRGFWFRRNLICASFLRFGDFPVIGVSLFQDEHSAFRLLIRPEQYLRSVRDSASAFDSCYKFAVTSSGDGASGTILGAVVMEGFYVVFDRGAKRVGFAASNCQDVKGTAAITSSIKAPRFVSTGNLSFCTAPAARAFTNAYDYNRSLMVASYVMGGVAIFLLGVMVFLLVQPCLWKKAEPKDRDPAEYEQFN